MELSGGGDSYTGRRGGMAQVISGSPTIAHARASPVFAHVSPCVVISSAEKQRRGSWCATHDLSLEPATAQTPFRIRIYLRAICRHHNAPSPPLPPHICVLL